MYSYVTTILRMGLRRAMEHKARVLGTRFYCGALSGESSYNIAINSDLSVSCNCQDYDGTGHIGNLRTHSLEQIFSSTVSTGFRESLAAGQLPLQTCARCVELRAASPEEAERRVHEYSLPTKGIMVENTVLCNLRCHGCYRRKVMKTRARSSMTIDDIHIVARALRDYGIEAISFFNLGEPFIKQSILEELRVIRKFNPTIRIGASSNGVLIDSNEKREAALLCNSLTVSLDGATQASSEKYQVGIEFDTAYENLRALAALRNSRGLKEPNLIWKYVLFNWNDNPDLIRKAISLARDAEIDELLLWPTFRPLSGFSLRYYLDPELRTMGNRFGRFPPSAYTRIVLNNESL